jgi:GxxExxY protein
MNDLDTISHNVIGEAIRIHQELGPGLLESVYQKVLAGMLARAGYHVMTEVAVPIEYRGISFDCALRIDILVEGSLVIEVKSVEKLSAIHAKQCLTYLRLSKKPLGLLLNFSQLTMKDGIVRLVNDHRPES